MDFFIKETNVRGGNRGGKNLFNWDDVRLLSNRDRQSYLGSTQALGLMDRGGKWYRKDWWTHYNNPVNVYGHKDKLNNRTSLLDEQKEIRKKEKEKLYEFIYGKKKVNNSLNLNLNDDKSVKEQINKIEIGKNINNNTKSEYGDITRPGLGIKNQMSSKDSEKLIENNKNNNKNKDKKSEERIYWKKDNINENNSKMDRKENNESKKQSHRHHHHHHEHRHHHNKSKNKSRNRSRSRARSRNRNRSRSRSRTTSK